MDFESLIKQLNELEKAKRREECRFLEERTAHEATEIELVAVKRELEEAKERVRELGEELACLKVEERNLRTTCDQLGDALKSSRDESRAMKSLVSGEIAETKQKRDLLANTLKNMVSDLRRQQQRYAAAVERLESLKVAPAEAAPPAPAPDAGSRTASDEELQELREKYDDVMREFDALDRYSRSMEKFVHHANQLMKSADVECPQCHVHLRICGLSEEEADREPRWVAAPVPQ